MAGEGIALADVLDIGDDLLVERLDGRAHPVGLLGVMAELVGMAEGRVLGGDLAPHVPAAAFLQLGIVGCGSILASQGGVLHAAAVGDEDEIVLREVDGALPAILDDLDALCQLVVGVGAVELHVADLDAVVELDVVALQILYHGQDHGLILVVLGEAQGGEVGKTPDVVDIALDIELHLQGAVPVLKGEHGPPVEPEVGVQDLVVEVIRDLLVLQILVGGEEELHDLHGALVGDGELAVSVGVLTAVDGGTAEGVVGVLLVEPVVLVQHADALRLDGGDGAEEVPHDLKVVVHLTAAPHHVAEIFEFVAVAGAAGEVPLLQNVDMLALHLAVPHEIAGGGEGCQAAADDIGGFLIHALGLLGAGKGFVVTAGIIHREVSFRCPVSLGILCFPVVAVRIPQFPGKRNQQKAPCDKFFITGRETV